MSIEQPGGAATSGGPRKSGREPRRRWRTLQNRIERARRLRHAVRPPPRDVQPPTDGDAGGDARS